MAEKLKSARKAACRAAPAANAQPPPQPPPPTARGGAGPASGERPGKSALDSVVSRLVRAAIGAGEADHIADDDLDKYVADLVLKEAKEKSKLFQQVGTRAYFPHTGL
ncbi:MAG: hypothetical protein BJ554DRAFT_7186 [Olpidium bornovanus]|uniref:Uncharacterized protein n=1 Tax=Olpidium bornovanus TaxID=278681 RepID=A0A8H7ZWV3_9FUNG|nr:MAG: hypothetical protein BJ554DRAFT_7186 [Olpidium bornovanus]